MSAPLYPPDYNPPNRGVCEVCAATTKSWDPRWLTRCPVHWQALLKGA